VRRLCAEDGIYFYFEPPSGLFDEATGGKGEAVAAVADEAVTAISDAAAGAIGGPADDAIGDALDSPDLVADVFPGRWNDVRAGSPEPRRGSVQPLRCSCERRVLR
jgi:hypothetical protein